MIDRELSLDEKSGYSRADEHLIVREIMIRCMYGMLLCLNRTDRIAFILAEIFDVSCAEGADILSSTPDAYRQRLSRAKKRLRDFMDKKCVLFNLDAPCLCEKQIAFDISSYRVRLDRIAFSGNRQDNQFADTIEHCLQEIDDLQRLAVLFSDHPDYALNDGFAANIRSLVESKTWKVLQ